MQKLVPLSLFLLLNCAVAAQNLPGFRKFYFNPSLFNPAFTGLDGYTEISITHRQQWLNVTDAPISSGVNAQFPTRSRVSIGINILTQEAVALRSTTAKAVFAYRIPISENQMFSFGISAGAGYNSLDLDGIDYSNDPAILGAADNRIYADGSFGAVYSLHGLKAGFALPRLFGLPYLSPQSLGGKNFSQLQNQLYSISYTFNVFNGNVEIEPYFFYRLNRDLQNSWEPSLLFYFKKKIWTGASYHSTQGIAFFLGMLIKEKIRFGYSYELPPFDKEFVSTSSHEVNISVRLGKKKVGKSKVSVAVGSLGTEGTPTRTPDINPNAQSETLAFPESIQQTPEIYEKTSSDSSTSNLNMELIQSPSERKVLERGYYIVVGSYRNFNNALNLQNILKSKGHTEVYIGFNEQKGMYYVYTFSTPNITEAKQKVTYYGEIADFEGAWLLHIE